MPNIENLKCNILSSYYEHASTSYSGRTAMDKIIMRDYLWAGLADSIVQY
jgi:hypothetical protein